MKLEQIVTVDRFLTTDPFNKRGQSGVVTSINEDIITVKFDDGVVGQYQIEALS